MTTDEITLDPNLVYFIAPFTGRHSIRSSNYSLQVYIADDARWCPVRMHSLLLAENSTTCEEKKNRTQHNEVPYSKSFFRAESISANWARKTTLTS